ncbi:MAG: RagB/SusD family nutrient uptake outer membrane protein [Tannerellaceae bacterium]|jgi:tetratricopeptide (TPR) repeat protein|nr:RagB/SusD family nutrient uptake outer membrane protein [Tannerellaceae bacterium]
MKYIVISIGMALFAGCSGNFIDLTPPSTATVANVYKTDKDFQDALVGCYNQLRSQYGAFWQWDLASDDARHQWATLDVRRNLDEYTYLNNEGIFSSRWNGYYTLIYRANYIIEAIENIDEAVVPQKQAYIGEAKFMRGMAHFHLVRAFGDVPLITKVILDEEALRMGRDPVNTVYEQIISDLKDAGEVLPSSYTGRDVGRATKGAAKSILGSVYLTHKNFPEAEAVLKEVTTMGYNLLDDFNDLWNYSKDEHHSEYIFDIEYESDIQLGAGFTNDFLPQQAEIAQLYGIPGAAGNSYNPSDELFDIFEDTDLRKDVTVAKGWTDAEGVYHLINPSGQGAKTYTKKYLTSIPRSGDSPCNWKVIRYADVLLMLAEALNENDKTAEALTYVNRVRKRAGVNSYPEDISKDNLREEIYDERRRELSFEGHRIWDLFRTGRILQACGPLGMQPHMVLFPIPLAQIQVMNNPAIFPQNPGWD